MTQTDISSYNRRLAELMVQDFEKEVALMLPHSGQAVCDAFGERVRDFHKQHARSNPEPAQQA